MIRFIDATLLALTKLRMRKIRTGMTLFVAALLFGILIAALITASGAYRSMESFSKEGLNSRYLVTGSTSVDNMHERLTDVKLVERAKQLFRAEKTAKEAEAELLGIPYSSSETQSPIQQNNDEAEQLKPFHPITNQVMKEYFTKKPQPGMAELRQVAAPYNLKSSFSDRFVNFDQGDSITTMLNGTETFGEPQQSASGNEPIFSQGLTIVSKDLINSFLLPNSTWKSSFGYIPIIVSQSQAEKLLGTPPSEKTSSSASKLQRIEQTYRQAENLVFHACYRNSVSQQHIEDALKANADNNPRSSITFSLPARDSCNNAAIKSDRRTETQKTFDKKYEAFNRKFGEEVNSIQKKLSFQVVGISPDIPESSPANNANELLRSLTSSGSFGPAIPKEMYEQLPNREQFDDIFTSSENWLFGSSANTSNILEFTDADDAKRFVDEQSCHHNAEGRCIPSSKPFQLTLFGGNSVALNDLKNKFLYIFQIAALVVATIAALIMGATTGRMIADSRRETAVFRAIGFKRSDIASIYIIYTLLLSGLVALLAFIIGISVAYGIDYYFWQDVTIEAKLAFGAIDPSREVHFFTVPTYETWLIIGVIFASGCISLLLPLTRNIRRNPIKDMRDE